jgi:hypothetical protein
MSSWFSFALLRAGTQDAVRKGGRGGGGRREHAAGQPHTHTHTQAPPPGRARGVRRAADAPAAATHDQWLQSEPGEPVLVSIGSWSPQPRAAYSRGAAGHLALT